MTSREETLSKLRALAASTDNDHERAAVLTAIEKLDVVEGGGEITVNLEEMGDGFEEFRILTAMAVLVGAKSRNMRVVVGGAVVGASLAKAGQVVVREFLELRTMLGGLTEGRKAAIANTLYAVESLPRAMRERLADTIRRLA